MIQYIDFDRIYMNPEAVEELKSMIQLKNAWHKEQILETIVEQDESPINLVISPEKLVE